MESPFFFSPLYCLLSQYVPRIWNNALTNKLLCSLCTVYDKKERKYNKNKIPYDELKNIIFHSRPHVLSVHEISIKCSWQYFNNSNAEIRRTAAIIVGRVIYKL